MQNRAIEIFYLFFQGVVCFQFIIFGIIFFLTKRKELLYYSIFLFFASVYFFVNAPYTFFQIPENTVWNSAWYEQVNNLVIITQNLFYLLFLKAFFLNIAPHQKVNRIFNVSLFFIVVLAVLVIFFTFSVQGYEVMYYTVQLIPVIPAVIVAVAIIKNKFPFASLVSTGLLLNITGTLLTVLMNILRNHNIQHLFTEVYPLFFIRVGILGDMIFLMIAILKKWHFQEKKLAIEQLQSQLKVEKLRNKISCELHDDIGSTLSGIKMYSHIMNEYLELGKYENARQSADIIQKSADDITSNLNDLVWTINPGKDNLQILADRIEEYAKNMGSIKNMQVKINIPVHLQEYDLNMEARRNIYLFCKEAINNAVKYSNASLLELTIKENGEGLEFAISDDGKGFDEATVKRGNGLNNMQQRADEIGAKLIIKSKQNEGTLLSMQLKIT